MSEELLIGRDGRGVGADDLPVVTAEDVQVRGHVLQVPGVRHKIAKAVPTHCARSGSGDISIRWMYRCRMPGWTRPASVRQGQLERLLGLEGAGARRRVAGGQVPELPRGQVHQGVGEQRHDVQIVRGRGVHLPHRICIRGVPHGVVGGRVRAGVAGSQRIDQGPLDGRCAGQRGPGPVNHVMGPLDGAAISAASNASHGLL